MPTTETVTNHVFVGGPLHGQCWPLDQLEHLGPVIRDYDYYWREVVTGSVSNRRAFVWRYAQ